MATKMTAVARASTKIPVAHSSARPQRFARVRWLVRICSFSCMVRLPRGFRIFPHDCWEPAMPAISGATHDLRVLRDVRGFFLVYIGFRWQRGSAVNADGIYLHFVPDSQR